MLSNPLKTGLSEGAPADCEGPLTCLTPARCVVPGDPYADYPPSSSPSRKRKTLSPCLAISYVLKILLGVCDVCVEMPNELQRLSFQLYLLIR